MSPRRRRVDRARPSAVMTHGEMRDSHFRELPRDVWDEVKWRWPKWERQSAPESFWRREEAVPDSLRARHPARPPGPSLGEDEELHASIRRRPGTRAQPGGVARGERQELARPARRARTGGRGRGDVVTGLGLMPEDQRGELDALAADEGRGWLVALACSTGDEVADVLLVPAAERAAPRGQRASLLSVVSDGPGHHLERTDALAETGIAVVDTDEETSS
jgi:hypothetical protein